MKEIDFIVAFSWGGWGLDSEYLCGKEQMVPEFNPWLVSFAGNSSSNVNSIYL